MKGQAKASSMKLSTPAEVFHPWPIMEDLSKITMEIAIAVDQALKIPTKTNEIQIAIQYNNSIKRMQTIATTPIATTTKMVNGRTQRPRATKTTNKKISLQEIRTSRETTKEDGSQRVIENQK